MAYLASLSRLQTNVRSEALRAQTAFMHERPNEGSAALVRLLEQLDADCREVRADVEQLIVGGEF